MDLQLFDLLLQRRCCLLKLFLKAAQRDTSVLGAKETRQMCLQLAYLHHADLRGALLNLQLHGLLQLPTLPALLLQLSMKHLHLLLAAHLLLQLLHLSQVLRLHHAEGNVCLYRLHTDRK